LPVYEPSTLFETQDTVLFAMVGYIPLGKIKGETSKVNAHHAAIKVAKCERAAFLEATRMM